MPPPRTGRTVHRLHDFEVEAEPLQCPADEATGGQLVAQCRMGSSCIEDGRYGGARNRAATQPPMFLWPKPLDLCLERGFDRPIRRLDGDHARPGIGDTASLADALDLRTLLREFASAQD